MIDHSARMACFDLSLRWVYRPFCLFCRAPTQLNLAVYTSRAMRKCDMSYANKKGADQPGHPRSLISAFVVRCLDSIISLDSIAKISRLSLTSVAAQAGLCLARSETPEDRFCRVVAHTCTLYIIVVVWLWFRSFKHLKLVSFHFSILNDVNVNVSEKSAYL